MGSGGDAGLDVLLHAALLELRERVLERLDRSAVLHERPGDDQHESAEDLASAGSKSRTHRKRGQPAKRHRSGANADETAAAAGRVRRGNEAKEEQNAESDNVREDPVDGVRLLVPAGKDQADDKVDGSYDAKDEDADPDGQSCRRVPCSSGLPLDSTHDSRRRTDHSHSSNPTSFPSLRPR